MTVSSKRLAHSRRLINVWQASRHRLSHTSANLLAALKAYVCSNTIEKHLQSSVTPGSSSPLVVQGPYASVSEGRTAGPDAARPRRAWAVTELCP